MAIYRVAGQMLQSTLERDGNSLAFVDTASTTAVLLVDIANSRVGVNSNTANVALDVAGNINAYNLSVTGNLSAAINISGANLNATTISATGNVRGGNINTAGLVSVTGNVISGNVNTFGLISAIGDITGGNITANFDVTATGNVTGGNILTGGLVSASGNITGNNVIVGNITIPSTGNVTLGNVNINYLANPSSNSDAATKYYVDNTTSTAFGNLTISNTTISTSLANGNITLSATGTELVQVSGSLGLVIPVGTTSERPGYPTYATTATGTIRFNTSTLQTEIWDGTQWSAATNVSTVITNQTLTGDGSTATFNLNQSATAESILVSINGVIQTPGIDYTTSTGPSQISFTTAPAIADIIQVRFIVSTSVLAGIQNGSSNVAIPTSNGNVNLSAGGVPNVIVAASTGAYVNGLLTVGNLSITGSVVGNIAGDINTTGNISTTGNITGVNLIGTVYTDGIINTGSNGTGNIGSATTTFDTIFAKATSAQYADLAEFYSADAYYEPGTVVSFGGNKEVTMSIQDADPCVAGVVSTNPSYIMNSGLAAEFPTQVALTGRVPCRVVGPVTKGAMMVSASGGYARAESRPAMGTVIGKALEAFNGAEGTIEIVVGRL